MRTVTLYHLCSEVKLKSDRSGCMWRYASQVPNLKPRKYLAPTRWFNYRFKRSSERHNFMTQLRLIVQPTVCFWVSFTMHWTKVATLLVASYRSASLKPRKQLRKSTHVWIFEIPGSLSKKALPRLSECGRDTKLISDKDSRTQENDAWALGYNQPLGKLHPHGELHLYGGVSSVLA